MNNILPERLLPKRRYKLINLDELKERYFLIRRCVCSAHKDHKNLKKIDPKCFIEATKHWGKGISCNLFGVFLLKDLSIRTNEEYWTPCFPVKKSKDIISSDLGNSLPIFIEIDKIHNQNFPYQHPHKIQKDIPDFKKKMRENKDEVNRLLEKEFKGSCKVLHKPTIGNYWHFEIYFFDEDRKQISNETIAFRTLINSFIQSFVFKASQYTNPVNYNVISQKRYDPLIPCWLQNLIDYIQDFLKLFRFKNSSESGS